MQYSPKLKIAMEQIKVILKQHDIAALIVLHTPGHSEYLLSIDPSYSCARFEGDYLRIKAKLAEFGGDKKAWELCTSNTSNMLNLIGEVGARTSMQILEISKTLDEKISAEHTGGGHTSHNQQNN